MESMFERLENSYMIDSVCRLSTPTVAVIGLGGGGCIVSEILVRTGVHHLILIDGDKFDISNKNRQLGALESTLGLYKVDVMKKRLEDINPNVNIKAVNKFLTKDNYIDLLCTNKVEFVCDTTDGNNKLLVADICKELEIPYVTGGCNGYNWFTAPIDNFNYFGRDCWGYPENDKLQPSSSPNPATVFIQAGFQAQELINMILERNWNMQGNKLCFDHMNYTMSVEKIKED